MHYLDMYHRYHPSSNHIKSKQDLIHFLIWTFSWILPTTVRAACFCKDHYPIFKELNNSSSTGCTLKFFSQPYEDILINDKTVVMRKSLILKRCLKLKFQI